ncbi:MAG: dimethyl sulfoxide reductase anchor subunit family protein [Candidatus Oxydemutatoraceae bacterium WSBS_2016_MAG_OTU14]
MHPALSVIFFTVISGLGYGLFMALALFGLWGDSIPSRIGVPASCLAFILITSGLLSSMFHLASPKNAWRAIHRFRTSWLAREGAFALLFYLPAVLYITLWWFNDERSSTLWLVLSLLVFILAAIVVFCTGMIYACLKTIRQWHTPLVPTNYLLYALMSGFALLLFLSTWLVPEGHLNALRWADIGLYSLAFTTHLIYVFWMKKHGGTTIGTATGFTRATVRLLDVGHTAGTFLTDEFGYVNKVSLRLLSSLRLFCIFFAFILPLALLVLMPEPIAYGVVVASTILGLFIERWLFFAKANHVVNLYHGSPTS